MSGSMPQCSTPAGDPFAHADCTHLHEQNRASTSARAAVVGSRPAAQGASPGSVDEYAATPPVARPCEEFLDPLMVWSVVTHARRSGTVHGNTTRKREMASWLALDAVSDKAPNVRP